jgi:hypothetical protein
MMKMTINNNQVPVKQPTSVADLQNTHELCALLLKTPHYAKMGQEGIFAIVETAKSLGVDPRIALGGGLYCVKGRVEMSSRMMAALIRAKKHSITRDRDSNDTICILHAKRADNGDQWTESFSMQEAQRAGLVTPGGTWTKFPRDMLYARALSRLARQLFPDIIGNCYVEGEIAEDPSIADPNKEKAQMVELDAFISKEQAETIWGLTNGNKELQDKLFNHLKITKLSEIKQKDYQGVINWLTIFTAPKVEVDQLIEESPYDQQ